MIVDSWDMGNVEGRANAIREIYRYFAYDHLPPHLGIVSKAICLTANSMLERLPDSAELTVGLRKLLESKDAFVRCAVTQASYSGAFANQLGIK